MKKRKKEPQIYPDEVFLDAENIPNFDRGRFEGKIEKPIDKKTFFMVSVFFGAIVLIFLGKIFSLQVLQGKTFAFRSENNRLMPISILPNRGIIYDRNNNKLAWNGPNSRVYLNLPGMAHVVGYVGFPTKNDFQNNDKTLSKETLGKDGIEKKYNSILSGVSGLKLIEEDSQNNMVSESVQKNPKNGGDIVLSIDSGIQSKLFKIIKSVVKKRSFHGGAGIILDVNNGEIISLANYPEYNSKILSDGKPINKIKGFRSEEHTSELQSH